MIYWVRRKIIQIAKYVPLIMVVIVLISYIESENSLYNEIFAFYNDDIETLSQPISFYIGEYVRYDFLTIIIMYALSFGLRMCWKNKLCIHYLALNLIQRYVYQNIFIDTPILHFIFILNIIMCTTIIAINMLDLKNMNYER